MFDKIFNELRKINIRYQDVIRKKYTMSSDIYNIESQILTECQILVKAKTGEEIINSKQKIDDLFMIGVEVDFTDAYGLRADISYTTKWVYTITPDTFDINNFYFPTEYSFDLDINLTKHDRYTSITSSSGLISKTIEISGTPDTRYQFTIQLGIATSPVTPDAIITNSGITSQNKSLKNIDA